MSKRPSTGYWEISVFTEENLKENGGRYQVPVSYTHLDVYKRQEAMRSGEISFTCETCGHSFCVPADYLVRHPFMFRKSVYKGNGMTGRTVRQSGRLFCPSCQKKTWCRQDMEESARIGMSGFGEALRKDGLRFLAGAAVLLAAGGIFFTVLNIVF